MKGDDNILKFLAFNRFIGKTSDSDLGSRDLKLNTLNFSDSALVSLFTRLQEHGIRYLACGGVAAAVYGYIQRSQTIEIWLSSEKNNCERFYTLLKIDQENRNSISLSCAETTAGENISLSIAFDLCYFKAHDFDSCHSMHKQAKLNSVLIQVLNLEHLIIEKMASGKLEESTAIKELGRIQRLRL